MGFLVSLFESRSIENPSVPLSAADDALGDALVAFRSSSGVRVNRETALTYSAIWKGVNLISGDVGKLPIHVYERGKDGHRHAVDHPAYQLLKYKPNDAMSSLVFRKTLQGHAILDGNGYAYIARNGAGEPQELIVLCPRQVTPVRYLGKLWYVYQFLDGETRKIQASDILHIRGFSYDGLLGYSLIHKARENIGLAMARETFAAIFFRNNARPNVVLQTPNKLSAGAAKNLRESWERIHSGLENAHRTAVLEEGLVAKELSINAADAQLIEQERFGLTHVANWLGLPPHKVGGDGRTAYASLEQENQAYLDEGLDPWLVTWEEESRDKLLTEEEKRSDSHSIRFARKELLRANLAARGSYYVQALQWGWMSPDEVRAEEGVNPQDAGTGKIYYRPMNMSMVGGPAKEAEEPTPAEAQQQAVSDGEQLLAVPDVRQTDSYSCGAASAMAVGSYFSVGPATLEEWKSLLGTNATDGTRPMAIVQALSELGLSVTAKHGMTVDDLRACWHKGMPVICCVQERALSKQDVSGHYVTVIGAALGCVFVQDSSIDNAMSDDDADEVPGRMMIDEAKWLEVWRDEDADGEEYVQFGIAVSQEFPIGAPEEEPEPASADDGEEADDKTPVATPEEKPATPADPAERSNLIATVKAMIGDAVRRMAKRIGRNGSRAAADRKRFGKWIDGGIEEGDGKVVREALAAAEMALAAMGRPASVSTWLMQRMQGEFVELSGRCTVATLPGEAGKLAAMLAEQLPKEAAELFLKPNTEGESL